MINAQSAKVLKLVWNARMVIDISANQCVVLFVALKVVAYVRLLRAAKPALKITDCLVTSLVNPAVRYKIARDAHHKQLVRVV